MSSPASPDGSALLRLARAELVRVVTSVGSTSAEVPDLGTAAGVFVTLRHGGELRGCIGFLGGAGPSGMTCPLGETTKRAAIGAACHDPRFPPVTDAELVDVRISISVLTPPRTIDSVEVVEVGRHGLIVELGAARGLLLPQVATERGWDRYRFLQETCVKAGLPGDAWQSPRATLKTFEAQNFEELE